MTRTSLRKASASALFGLLLAASLQAAGAGAEFCWSETWGRGVGTIPASCGAGQEKNGALCYPTCQAGFVSDGVAGCIQSCPPGAQDDGLFCGWPSYKAAEYPAWDEKKCKANHSTGCWQTVPTIGLWVENCREGYKHIAGFCEKSDINCAAMGLAGNRIANSCAKKHYFRDTLLPACGSGQEYDAGLCYTPCRDNADGVGPVCWGKGPPGWVQCGMGWAKDQQACNHNITEQVVSVVDAAIATTVLIGSLGASAATASGTRVGSVLSKGAWQNLKNIGKVGAKKVLVDVGISHAISAGSNIASVVGSTTNDTIEYLWQVGELEHESPNMTQVERDHAIAQIALNTVSFLDPTGVVGVVAAYTKPICKDVGAMQTRALESPAPTAPTGGIAEVMKARKVVATNFATQRAEIEAKLATAKVRSGKLQAQYNAAPSGMQATLKPELDASLAHQIAIQAHLERVKTVEAQLLETQQQWQTLLASTGAAGQPSPPPMAAPSWGETGYKAHDISAGANGAVWFIGAQSPNNADGGIFRLTPAGPQQVAGGAMRIAVDPSGNPWVVNSGGAIFRWNGSTWQQMSGAARDVGIGADGSVWVIGTNAVQGGYGIWRYVNGQWVSVPGGAERIAVDPSGNAWVINNTQNIFRYAGGQWQMLSGSARDIGIGADGTVYVVGSGSDNSQVWRWVPEKNNWEAESGVAGANVAGGPYGTAYVARSRESNMPVIARTPR